MVYPYMILADGTEIVHTQVFEEDGIQKVDTVKVSSRPRLNHISITP